MKKTKTELAAEHADSAVLGFSQAQGSLDLAIALLAEAESEHLSLAEEHQGRADYACVERERNIRIRERLAALLA